MSTGGIIALAVAASVVFLGGLVVMVVWLHRSGKASEQAALGRLHEEIARRGWAFEERNDAFVSVYNAQNEFAVQSLWQLVNELSPYAPAPRAVAARDIVTGNHRGRPFIAATFDVDHRGEISATRVIWVRTPAVGPPLTVNQVLRAESRIRAGIGQDDVRVGNPDFDERFEVITRDGRFAMAVLNPRMVQFLLTDPRRHRGFSLLGDHLAVIDPVSDHRDPAELIPALDLRCDLLDLIPSTVWAQ